MRPASADLVSGPAPVDVSVAVHEYEGRAAQAVRRLKYERVLSHVDEMAAEMSSLAVALGLAESDLVVPVPIHWSRHCERGFNQSLLLASGFERCDLKALKRIRRTRQQVGLTPEQRLSNLKDAFRAGENARGKTVLLIDDVITSGGTARECAKALKAAGAIKVDLLTYCAGGSVYDA